jgi:hypothetical protein
MPMNFRIDMKIIALEPQPGGLTLIEGLATDGTSVVVTVRVAEPLAVGGWMTMALLAEPAAAQPATAASMRERMQVRASGLATASAAQTPRSATAVAAVSARRAPAAAAGDASSLLLSSILGNRGGTAKNSELFDNSPLVERNVDDEMDALFGAPPRKG